LIVVASLIDKQTNLGGEYYHWLFVTDLNILKKREYNY
jgi:hypothetical protein